MRRSGHEGPYFKVLNCDSEYALSLLVRGRKCDCVIFISERHCDRCRDVIAATRSAWMERPSGSTPFARIVSLTTMVASAPAIPRCAQSIERIAHRRNGDIMMLIDKVNANFHPLDSLSSRLIASKMSAIFFIRREISPRAQASSEGTYSDAQGVAYNDGNGYLSVVYFLAQALDELAGAIDSSLPIVTGTRLQSHPL